MSRIFLLFLLWAGWGMAASAAEARLEEVEIPRDAASLERGAETVATVCQGCHNLRYVKYRDLAAMGIAKDKVDGWRGGQPMDASMTSPMSEADARATFSGVSPPDLSMIAAARDGGGRYLYTYLTGYHKDEKGELTNSAFPLTRMPDVLGSADATEVSQRAELAAKARDIAGFLVWASDPHAQERERLGYYVLGYVAFMTLLLFLWKQKIWREIDRRPKIQ